MSSSSATSDTTPPPQGRLIDPRGHRFGAGVSVVLLTLAYLLNLPVVVGAVAVALAVSAIFGTRYSALGRPWPYVRRALNIAPPKELEGEYPPRFAQALGSVVLAVAIVLFLVGGDAGVAAGRARRRASDPSRRHGFLPGLPTLLPALVAPLADRQIVARQLSMVRDSR